MGYVHDTHMHQWIPPTLFHCATGTYADAAGQVANTIVSKRTAADANNVVTIPIPIPMNDGPERGAYLVSVDIYFEILTGALDALAATIYSLTLPADAAAISAPTSQSFDYDTGHDAAGERIDVDQHTMTLTLDTPIWVADDELVSVELAVDGSAGGVLDLIGARANYTLRL